MDWENTVHGLITGAHTSTGDELDAGAQLVVEHPGGEEAYRAALARHYRLDEEQENLLWVRPIVPGGLDPETGERTYNLNACRRRSLAWTRLQVQSECVVFTLVNDQVARIEPAQGEELDELRSWDAFQLNLTGEEEQELEQLREDSWWGRYA
ncbi:hypothetical protein [Nocardiopsis tropica]|uniref:Uncharacterized protein n=1 Tax=Nocardiopsis tropica TaxID=109330 RepID=A0ABU7KMW6_9ACTN|nr:hypothetical protein [Nocardiopsis umidischolae]MEE2050641.1 hypothetical protein [Nocardiopsis umidischolae]